MYINKIDDFVDKVIDDYYNTLLADNRIKKITSELNFVKYQSDLNDIFKKYISTLNINDIKDTVSNNDILNKIIEVIKKYITIYTFLYIGFLFKGTDTIYANNIIEFSKNQPEYGYKIEDFFNSESNASVVELYSFIKKMLNILDAESKQRKETLSNRQDYKEVVNFLNEFEKDFGKDFMEVYFYNKNENLRAHNIIKLIIILKIYKGTEKKDLFRILDLLENTETEFTFIDIVVPIKEIIDISTIESLLSKKEIQSGLAKTIWEYMYESELNETMINKNNDEKINELINSNLFVPIVDDILLYHNPNENYEKFIEDSKTKSKEDTKIRYIIEKIDTATNLNIPEKHSEAKKLFYQPMYNRKAVLINNFEDLKIINKFININRLSSENIEYLKDLDDLVIYPYINLRDSTNGIFLPLTKTIDALRYVNFEKSTEFKQRPNSYLENRVGSKNNFINVVGFLIKPSESIYCIKNKNLIEVTDKKNTNGYISTLNMIENNIKKDTNLNCYWLFNPDNDKIETNTYEQQNKFTRQDQIKQMLAVLYDSIEKLTYDKILTEIKNLKNPYIDEIEKVINKFYKLLLKVEKKNLLIEMENEIYDKLIKRSIIKYDELDDLVNGLSKNSIKLPEMKNIINKKQNKVLIDLSKLTETGTYEEKEKVEGVCQHNITWDRIGILKKENPKLFLDELYIFVQQYVIENVEHDFVCKSCGFFLNIKKYVADGAFDDDHHFITYSMPLDTPLEDIPEYEKYKGTIRNIDKYIEKIALITSISYFIGNNPTVKSRRKLVVRDTIDVILANNIKLKKVLKERNEIASKIYGINRNFSNLFVFELENSIFIFSSKDSDFYKPIKQNNILGYIIYLIMLELNESQILYFNNDKKGYCNFEIFDKVYNTLFEGLKFRKNNKGDTVNVKDYPIFCYMIYMISCYCVKYNLWYYDYKDKANDKATRIKLLPSIQKIIIHTVIDIINSCIENSEDLDKKNKIFEILKSKFYKKLNSTFSNKDLYNRLKEQNSPSTVGDKKQFILTKTDTFKLDGKYLTDFESISHWRKIKQPILQLDIKSRNITKYNSINNITNCESGLFHNWNYDDKTFKCSLCNIKSNINKYDEKITENIRTKFHIVELKSLSKKYCYIDGNFHEFSTDKSGIKICTKCKSNENKEYTQNELEKLDTNLIKNKENSINQQLKIIKENEEENKKYNEYIKKLLEKVNEEYNQYQNEKYIDDLIDLFENNINESLKSNISIKHNIYVFNHNHLGAKLDKDISISEKENKVQFRASHPFFNTDVIYYTTYKNGKIDVFYDSTTKILLGYKEENKNFVLNIKNQNKITIIYSIKNKLKMLGHKYQFYTIKNESDKNDKSDIISIIQNIIRERHSSLKTLIYRFQRVLYRILNNYIIKKKVVEGEYINIEEDYFNNKFENLVEKYAKKLLGLNIVSQKGTHLVFKHWKNFSENIISNTFDFNDFNDKNINTINYEKINKYDSNGNLLLFYFINELIKLYKYNDDKLILQNITGLLIDFINNIFSIYNEEVIKNNSDYKRFIYIMNSVLYLDEIKDKFGEIEDISEIDKELTQEEQDKIDDANEEDEALDIEGGEYDYEAGYERNLERPLDEDFVNSYEINFLDYYKLQHYN
jgi:hypothetical protein